jgi:hypothetical protein
VTATTELLREMGFKNLVVGVKGNVLDEDVIEFENAERRRQTSYWESL